MSWGVFAAAQISPGPLAHAHQSLEGPTHCTDCHTESVRARAFHCTDCHSEIAAEVTQHRGLHSTFPSAGEPGEACVKCHSDHNGEGFNMVHWDPTPKGFDHSRTGYVLEGKHAGAACRSCHTASHIGANARALLQKADLNHTYLGLSKQCAACHEDKHQGRLGQDCGRCHNPNGWGSASIPLQGFDHGKTRFPLTGAHREVACAKCHTAGPDGQPRYAGIAFGACSSCHADVHKGEFRQGCDSCHTTSTWKKSSFERVFDHAKTNFPLLGKHADAGCVSCHKGGDFKGPIAHAQCADCHQPDPHGGQFAGTDCKSCHTVSGWSPSTFSVADHAKTGFPLGGPHAKVECGRCHVPAGTKTQFKMAFGQCTDCHKDEHEGQFAGDPWRNRCEACHQGMTWKSTSFTLASHQKTAFPLTGSHAAVVCTDCHKPMNGAKTVPYHFGNLECTTCHADVHHGEFAVRMARISASHRPLGCEACHNTGDWHDLKRFDHESTRFALEGAHRAVGCAACHKPPNLERTMVHVKFGEAPVRCGECHQNPHADQFGARAQQCETCHGPNKWRPSLFDHEKTAFPLRGGHQGVACSACHRLTKPIGAMTVLFYKPTPTACEACHASGAPKASAGME